MVILDEPTASIDAEAEIFDTLDALGEDKTVIVISHRFNTVRNVDTIVLIEEGKIIEKGDHDTLIAQKGKYYELFKLQADKFK